LCNLCITFTRMSHNDGQRCSCSQCSYPGHLNGTQAYTHMWTCPLVLLLSAIISHYRKVYMIRG
jgi:hypothetical protein